MAPGRPLPRSAAVLALTGGGILARFGTEALAGLHEMRIATVGADPDRGALRQAFDLVAGTSAGALVAAGLAIGRSPAELSALFDRHGPLIFPHKGKLTRLLHLRTALYRKEPLEAAIDDAFQGRDPTFGEIELPLAIPALNESTGHPVIFTNLDPVHHGVRLRDAILASAAAPTYLPAHVIDGDRYVDGGLFANAPDLVALNLTLRRWPSLGFRDIHLVSIGTSAATRASPVRRGDPGDWGLLRWGINPPARIVALTLQAQVEHTMSILPTYGLADFLRLEADLTDAENDAIGLDTATLEALRRLAEAGRAAVEGVSRKEREALQRIVTRNRFDAGPR